MAEYNDEHKYCVYKHTSPSQKCYIGMTGNDPNIRWRGGAGYAGQKYFHNAIKKYGWENFKHEIIASGLTREEAFELEKAMIAKYK